MSFNKEIQDVMDFVGQRIGCKLKEAYTKKIINEIKESSLNNGFQKLASILVTVNLRI